MENKNKTFINQLYDTWSTYKNLYNSTSDNSNANIYRCIMCDIVYLYSEYTNTDYDVSKRLFNCAYEIGLNNIC